jgi:hypothetical protein
VTDYPARTRPAFRVPRPDPPQKNCVGRPRIAREEDEQQFAPLHHVRPPARDQPWPSEVVRHVAFAGGQLPATVRDHRREIRRFHEAVACQNSVNAKWMWLHLDTLMLTDFRNVVHDHGQEKDLFMERLVAPKMVDKHLGNTAVPVTRTGRRRSTSVKKRSSGRERRVSERAKTNVPRRQVVILVGWTRSRPLRFEPLRR